MSCIVQIIKVLWVASRVIRTTTPKTASRLEFAAISLSFRQYTLCYVAKTGNGGPKAGNAFDMGKFVSFSLSVLERKVIHFQSSGCREFFLFFLYFFCCRPPQSKDGKKNANARTSPVTDTSSNGSLSPASTSSTLFLIVDSWLLIMDFWLSIVGCWLMIADCRFLIIQSWLWLFNVYWWLSMLDRWLLSFDCWLLVDDFWLLVDDF